MTGRSTLAAAVSSGESEFYAIVRAIIELLFLIQLIQESCFSHSFLSVQRRSCISFPFLSFLRRHAAIPALSHRFTVLLLHHTGRCPWRLVACYPKNATI